MEPAGVNGYSENRVRGAGSKLTPECDQPSLQPHIAAFRHYKAYFRRVLGLITLGGSVEAYDLIQYQSVALNYGYLNHQPVAFQSRDHNIYAI